MDGIFDDDFDWLDFFREQFNATVDNSALDKMKKEYQGSDEEKRDVLKAYQESTGNMDRIYEGIIFSNVVDDDDRFRGYIDHAIAHEQVEPYETYTHESVSTKQKRLKAAQKEARQAVKLQENLDSKKRSKGKKADDGLGDLAALIQQRQQSRGESFLDNLDAKYGSGAKKSQGKRKAPEEPPEEAFARTAARKVGRRKK